jgi:hypothetical protein
MVTVLTRYTTYTTSNNIFVSLGITNPNAINSTFTMKMYDYWYSGSRFSMVISTTTSYTVDTTYASNSQLEKSRITMYPFRSRQSMTANAPLRIRFRVTSGMGYPYGRFTLVNNQFQYSSSFLCYYKKYTSFKNLMQETDYSVFSAASCTSSGTSIYA